MRRLRDQINANAAILIAAIGLDTVVLIALLIIKARTDMLVIYAAVVGMLLIFVGERLFLRTRALSS